MTGNTNVDLLLKRDGIRCYIFWFLSFLFCSILGQYGCTIPVDLSFILGQGWWIPLGVISIVPMVDVSRSFTQHYAEKINIDMKFSVILMFFSSLVISLLFSFQGMLPVNICLATFLAVNVGGGVDILLFKLVYRISPRPHIRMLFSNLGATLSGGGLFYIIAYSDFLTVLASVANIHYVNPLHMDNLVKGWILQSIFIWFSGVVMAFIIGKGIEVRDVLYLRSPYL